MKYILILVINFGLLLIGDANNMKLNNLSSEEERIIIHKGTEPPFSGQYNNFFEEGIYTCKQCNAELYLSKDKFNSHCGWPSFDDEIENAIKKVPDIDGHRTEILCANCNAHLGHVFYGENLTNKNTRHCVNSISMNFISTKKHDKNIKIAIFGSGCFWGTEYMFKKSKGVLDTRVGYTGGNVAYPTYKQVCSGTTGHVEAVEITFDNSIISYKDLVKLFFETHDFTQINRQGPDIGEQYRSVIFYIDVEQKQTAEQIIEVLNLKGYKVATTLEKATTFWQAEDYHQDYYNVKGGMPYCHTYKKIF